MALYTYDPKNVIIIFAGIPIISGFGPDTFIRAERNEESWQLAIGVSGEAARFRSNDKSGKVTLTLMQSSQFNTLLSTLNNVDERTPAGAGIGPFLLKDLTGTTLLAAGTCWITKPAVVDFAKDSATREWTIETDNLDILVGGLFSL